MFFTLFIYFFFENNAVGRRPLWCVVELLPQDIAWAFVGRFRFGLQRFFFAEEKPFLANGTDFKIVARWRYDWCANARGNCQNLRKWVQSLCQLVAVVPKAHGRANVCVHRKSIKPYNFQKCFGGLL